MRRHLIAAGVIVMLTLAGCVLTPEARAKLAVQYATLKVVESAEAPAERAARVRNIAQGAIALADSGDQVSVGLIESAVRARIDWAALSLSDRLAATALIDTLRIELENRVGAGELNPDSLVSVRTVLGWVIEATNAVSFAAAR